MVFSIPADLLFSIGMVIASIDGFGAAGPTAVLVGTLVIAIAVMVISLRLFWADDFALMHGSGPIEALQQSWHLTRNGARQVFNFRRA